MMDRLINAMKAHSGAQDASGAQPRFAKITSVDPQLGTVRVLLQPEGVLTGWLPVLSLWVGSGWGLSCPPDVGDQGFVLAQEGDADHGVVVGRAWSEQSPVPNTPVGELWLPTKAGVRSDCLMMGL